MIHLPSRPLARLRPSENSVLLALAIGVGMATGVGIYLYRSGIHFFHDLFVVQLGEGFIGQALASLGLDPRWSIVPVLALAGLLVGLLMARFVGPEKYHGVAGIIESVALAGGRLPWKKMPAKGLASAMSLGAGASIGPEDPSVQIGSNLGAFFGQKLRLSEDRVRLLVSAGAASAISAAFNAPVAGVFFALEVILGEFTSSSFGIVVLAAVVSSGFTRFMRGENPIFDGLERFELGDPLQLIFYALLGLGLAFFASLAVRTVHATQDFAHRRCNHLPRPLRTAVVGALVGVVGIVFPPILGPGEEFMHDILTGHAQLSIGLLLLLGFVKLAMTSLSLAGGFVGGVFAPSLFMGTVLGSAYGQLLQSLFPQANLGQPQTFAIAGMAALMAGIVRAPITAILIVFEITNDYALILPIMLASVVCVFVLERGGPAGIYHLALLKQGLRLQQGRDVDVMQGIMVQEAMQSPAPSILGTATLRELRDALQQHQARAMCIVDESGALCGIVTLGDLQRAFERYSRDPEGSPPVVVGDICTRDVVTAFPEDALWTAVRNMGARDIGRLPVVKEGTHELVGILGRHDIMNAYNMAIARKLHDQHYAEQIRLNTLTGAHVLEYHIKPDSTIHERRIAEIKWPPESVVASVRRRGKLIVPHGDTRLMAGDMLTIVADADSQYVLDQLFAETKAQSASAQSS